ncbi:MAG: L-arabinose isomerase family protein [Planctomycetota bacterium]
MEDKNGILKVGILPSIAELYNRVWPEVKNRLDNFIKELVSKLEDENLEVQSTEVVSTLESVGANCRKLEAENVDLLIVVLAAYCPSGVLAPALKEVKTPVLLWPAQSMFELKGQDYDMDTVLLNHGVHGLQDLANVLGKSKKAFGVIHGHLKQKDFKEELCEWAKAGRAIRAMQKANPIQIGGHFRDMLDLQIGDDEFIRQMGAEPKIITPAEFVRVLNEPDEKMIKEYVNNYKTVFEIADDVTEELLIKTAKGEIALSQIMQQENSFACSLNFLQLCNDRHIADGLHVAASRLMCQGYGYSGEGDWVTAMLIRGMQQVFGIASFSEIFSVGYADNQLVLKHWGEGNFAMAREKPKLCVSCLEDTITAKFAIVDFEFKPGLATLVNLNSTAKGNGQLISIAGQITEGHLPKVNGPRAIFKPAFKDVRELLTEYAYNGGSHHLALINADCADVLNKMSRLTGWKYINL